MKSPYTAAITGCAFLYNEFMRILPLLMAENVESLLKEEVLNNRLLQVNSQKARQTFITEFKRRYRAVPVTPTGRFAICHIKGIQVGFRFPL